MAALEEKVDPVHRPKVFDLAHSIPQSADTGVRQFVEAPMKRKQKKSKNHQDAIHNESNNTIELATEENEAEDT